MKKIVLFAAMMLLGAAQNMNAQNGVGYSLEGIGETLSKLNSTSSVIQLGDFHEGLAKIEVRKGSDNLYGYIDMKGNIAIPCIYSMAKDFSEGLARVCSKDWNYGFIDKQGNTVIPFTLGEHVSDFSEGLACVNKDERQAGYINKKGELVIPYMKLGSLGKAFGGGIAPIRIGKYVTYFIDKSGKEVIPPKPFRCEGYKDGFYAIKSDGGGYGLMDTKGNIVVPIEYDLLGGLSEGLCIAVRNKGERTASGYSLKSMCGFIDTNDGKVSIPLQYEEVRPFSEGLAAVQDGGKWGYINKQGDLVIPYKYKKAYDFHEKLAFVKTDDGYVIIDKQGNTIQHLPNYEYFGEMFCEGLAVIERNGKWGYVDVYGNSTFDFKSTPRTKTTIQTKQPTKQIASKTSSPTTKSTFVGGETAMNRFIASNLRYPVVAEENGEQGTVVVGFTVEADGSLTNIHIEKSVSGALDKEALRIVRRMPNWQPAQSGGVRVKSTQTVNVKFRL